MTKNTEKEFWQDIDVYSVNTEPRSAAGFPRDEAWEKKTVSLNGVWKFHYCESVNDIIEGYYAPDFDLSVRRSRSPVRVADKGLRHPDIYQYQLSQGNLHHEDPLHKAGAQLLRALCPRV